MDKENRGNSGLTVVSVTVMGKQSLLFKGRGLGEDYAKGAIHKGRPHPRGEGGLVKSGHMRTQGEGGSVAKCGRPQIQIFYRILEV